MLAEERVEKLEAKQAESPATERLCWYLNADGSGGLTVSRVGDPDAAAALQLERRRGAPTRRGSGRDQATIGYVTLL